MINERTTESASRIAETLRAEAAEMPHGELRDLALRSATRWGRAAERPYTPTAYERDALDELLHRLEVTIDRVEPGELRERCADFAAELRGLPGMAGPEADGGDQRVETHPSTEVLERLRGEVERAGAELDPASPWAPTLAALGEELQEGQPLFFKVSPSAEASA